MKKVIALGVCIAIAGFFVFRIDETNKELNKAVKQIKGCLKEAFDSLDKKSLNKTKSLKDLIDLMSVAMEGRWEHGLTPNGVRMGETRLPTLIMEYTLANYNFK